MSNLVVTGGCGFLGIHICNRLKDKYEKILVIDIDEFNKNEYPENVIYKKLDIRDYDGLKEAFNGYDLVVNAAAALPLWKPKDIHSTN
ncbi:MAG TPA: NAD-dependent epimerase/dehydratase family protein, partial [Candidatus Goldiibacteriota bacterium]|nr:NAD-dependent epimerase/dehydratase family protein [Candidatus Goldiibacteriota bacterium]